MALKHEITRVGENPYLKERRCHTPFPVRPDWRIRTEVRDAILSILYTVYWDSHLPILSQSCTCTSSIQTISVIKKIILHVQKNYHRSGVHQNLYTYTESHLLIHVQFLLQNFRDYGSSAGEHLSLSRPALLMWNVLSSSLLFDTYTD